MFVCLYICLFTDLFVFFVLNIMGHAQEVLLKVSWWSNLIWLRYLGSKKCLFVCFFVCLLIDLFVFYFNDLGTPIGIYPENFVNIWLDFAEIKIVGLFVDLLFVLSFCFHHLVKLTGRFPESLIKIGLASAEIGLI